MRNSSQEDLSLGVEQVSVSTGGRWAERSRVLVLVPGHHMIPVHSIITYDRFNVVIVVLNIFFLILGVIRIEYILFMWCYILALRSFSPLSLTIHFFVRGLLHVIIVLGDLLTHKHFLIKKNSISTFWWALKCHQLKCPYIHSLSEVIVLHINIYEHLWFHKAIFNKLEYPSIITN